MQTPPDSLPRPIDALLNGGAAASARRSRLSLERVLVLLSVVWFIALAAVGTWADYWADRRNDQYVLLYAGQRIYDGGHMYVDCWENKPPGIAWINALGIALTPESRIAAWIAPGVVLVLCLGVAALAMEHLLSLTAACGTLLIGSAVTTLRLYDTPSINPDFYSAMFELTACSLWLLSLSATGGGRRVLWGLAAGLAWAASATVKQTGAAGLLAVSLVAIVLALTRRAESRRWLGTTGVVWIGFALGAGAVTAVLIHQQTLEIALSAIFQFNRGLVGADSLWSALTSWSRLWAGLQPLGLPLWLALVGTVAVLWNGGDRRMSRSVACALLLLWIAQAVLTLLGPSRSMRYWQATWPAMLWLAGAGIYCLEDALRRLSKGNRAAIAVACATIVLLLGRTLADHYERGLAGSYLAYQNRAEHGAERNSLTRLGQQLQKIVPEGEAIYVWGYGGGPYLYASRPAASRFIHPRSADHMREILDDLQAGKAYAVLVPYRGSAEFDLWCDERCNYRLVEILSSYEEAPNIDHYQVWTRPPNFHAPPTPAEPASTPERSTGSEKGDR